jgi:hypothetical protein
MILKASQRAGGRSLAMHLLNTQDNEHVSIHSMRGVASQNVYGAFQEIECIASATNATKPFFSCAINPPPRAEISIDQFETAIAAVEKKMGLEDQQRVVLFHEKNGRRHCHVCWGMVQTVTKTVQRNNETMEVEQLAAIKLGMYKYKLKEVSRDLFLQFGLELPKGLQKNGRPDPLNYDRQTWQQCARLKEDPRDLKKLVRDTLHQSDTTKAFMQGLEEQGLFLARGDKRGFVLIHHTGEILALTRYSGMKAKELRDRLGDPAKLPTVEQAQDIRKERMTKALHQMKRVFQTKHKEEWQPFKKVVHALKTRQRSERAILKRKQDTRMKEESLVRANRLRKGLMGWWDRFTGHRGRTIDRNKREQDHCQRRDRAEQDKLIARHLQERRDVQKDIDRMKQQHTLERQQFRTKMGFLFSLDSSKMRGLMKDHLKERDGKRQEQEDRNKGKVRGRGRTRSRGPDDPSP